MDVKGSMVTWRKLQHEARPTKKQHKRDAHRERTTPSLAEIQQDKIWYREGDESIQGTRQATLFRKQEKKSAIKARAVGTGPLTASSSKEANAALEAKFFSPFRKG